MKIPFGKYASQELDSIPKYYLKWLLANADLTERLKAGIENVLSGKHSDDVRTSLEILNEYSVEIMQSFGQGECS